MIAAGGREHHQHLDLESAVVARMPPVISAVSPGTGTPIVSTAISANTTT